MLQRKAQTNLGFSLGTELPYSCKAILPLLEDVAGSSNRTGHGWLPSIPDNSTSAGQSQLLLRTTTMTTTQLKLASPVETSLPPLKGEVLTDAQWTTLMAIADTIIPSIQVSSVPSTHTLTLSAPDYTAAVEAIKPRLPHSTDGDLLEKYFQESPSSIPAFRQLLKRLLTDYVREEARRGIRVILSTLE